MCYSDDHLPSASAMATDLRRRKTFPVLKKSAYEIDCKGAGTKARNTIHQASLALLEVVGGVVIAFGTVLFSQWFPFILTPEAASKTYLPAFYNYNAELSHFDNSAWTYGTDYVLTIVMALLAYSCLSASTSLETRALRYRSAGLLLCYSVSVTAGGWAHQHYTTLESRNTLDFRILWTICVGTVTAAGGFMGSCASEVSTRFDVFRRVPEALWIGFGLGTTLLCALGGLSYQRPACDIFIAGTTQSPPTFFLMAVVGCTMTREKCHISFAYKIVCLIGFIANAPLLPMYSLLIQYTDWSLAAVNTLLHCWLMVAWTKQALSLRHFVVAMDQRLVDAETKQS
jgi:hypothetical protein